MICSTSRKLVLYLPRRDDPARNETYSADLLPLELLQIAGGPDAEGFEIVLIDAMVVDDPLPRILEACEDALLFASSAILGYQVHDGHDVARAVRERFPRLPIVWGGWFPSVAPEMYFEAGIADAVALGQGERTFLDVVHALHAGCDLEEVAGLALWRDGALVKTPPRRVVGFEELHATPWHLLDFEPYRARQLAPARGKVRHRWRPPPAWRKSRPPVSFSLSTSYGCPMNCSFCCSPGVTGRCWKAIGGAQVAEMLIELKERFAFEAVRFNEANWGVSEERARTFCEVLVSSGTQVWWNAPVEIEAILRYADATLDLMAAAGCYYLAMGAETDSVEMQERIGKHVPIDQIPHALSRVLERDITAGCYWIIGFPGETPKSMWSTLRCVAETKHALPRSAPELYLFRAIPGTPDFAAAQRRGWALPSTFQEWGSCFEWNWHNESTPLPQNVRTAWSRYASCAAHYGRAVTAGPRWLRSALSTIAGWRLRTGIYGFPAELKLFDWCTQGR